MASLYRFSLGRAYFARSLFSYNAPVSITTEISKEETIVSTQLNSKACYDFWSRELIIAWNYLKHIYIYIWPVMYTDPSIHPSILPSVLTSCISLSLESQWPPPRHSDQHRASVQRSRRKSTGIHCRHRLLDRIRIGAPNSVDRWLIFRSRRRC